MKPQSKRESGHPLVDETAFQQLLSAAFVMQEHNGHLRKVAAGKTAPQVAAPLPEKAPAVASSTAPHIPFPAATELANANSTCQECGSTLAPHEFFCEDCGAPAARTENTTQKNWASLWEMHHAAGPEAKTAHPENQPHFADLKTVQSEDAADEPIDLFPAELEEIVGKFSPLDDEDEADTKTIEPASESLTLVPANLPAAAPAESQAAPQTATWTSAAKARAWLDSMKGQQTGKDWFREEWNVHRGMIAIALASAVLLAVLFQWATQPAAVPGHTRELSGFEQLLVSMGLAEPPAPAAVAAPGNPDTKVWVDVHTALYYCPGAEFYGKTADGKYTSQADAQRDQFQPSTLKACD